MAGAATDFAPLEPVEWPAVLPLSFFEMTFAGVLAVLPALLANLPLEATTFCAAFPLAARLVLLAAALPLELLLLTLDFDALTADLDTTVARFAVVFALPMDLALEEPFNFEVSDPLADCDLLLEPPLAVGFLTFVGFLAINELPARLGCI
ncbi:MAG: hypothetical protein KF752_17730 [Pirellulaceae bacterium]|nr:hypothetical protein [Pirellulaceae bacterium]